MTCPEAGVISVCFLWGFKIPLPRGSLILPLSFPQALSTEFRGHWRGGRPRPARTGLRWSPGPMNSFFTMTQNLRFSSVLVQRGCVLTSRWMLKAILLRSWCQKLSFSLQQCWIKSQRQRFGWNRKRELLVALPGKGGHSGIQLSKAVSQPGGFDEKFYSNSSMVGLFTWLGCAASQ